MTELKMTKHVCYACKMYIDEPWYISCLTFEHIILQTHVLLKDIKQRTN